MCVRMVWLPAIALMAAVGTSGPAAARGGGGGGLGFAAPHAAFAARAPFATGRFHAGTRRIARGPFIRGPFIRGGDFGRGRGVARNIGPVVAWPYLWSLDAGPQVIQMPGSDPPSAQPLIIAAGPPPQSYGPAPLPDFSYVAGCHAIPGGYHCDPPQPAAAKP
jgi:hypothetical protein